MTKLSACVTTILAATACTGEIDGGGEGPRSTYAESVYGNYEEAAGGKVDFELSTVETGKLDAIATRPLSGTVYTNGGSYTDTCIWM